MLSGCVVLSLEGGKPLLVFTPLISVCNQRLLSVLNALQLLLLPLPPSLHAPQHARSLRGMVLSEPSRHTEGAHCSELCVTEGRREMHGFMLKRKRKCGAVGSCPCVQLCSFETLVAARCCTGEVLTNSRLQSSGDEALIFYK